MFIKCIYILSKIWQISHVLPILDQGSHSPTQYSVTTFNMDNHMIKKPHYNKINSIQLTLLQFTHIGVKNLGLGGHHGFMENLL